MSGNREYKSDVFSMLMEDPGNALRLYNAINGSDYTDSAMVEICTLDRGYLWETVGKDPDAQICCFLQWERGTA